MGAERCARKAEKVAMRSVRNGFAQALLAPVLAVLSVAACSEKSRLADTIAEARVSPTSLSFGDAYLGATPQESVTLESVGTGILTVSRVAIEDELPPSFFYVDSNFPGRLRPSETWEANVYFLPQFEAPASAMLVFETNAADNPMIRVPLSANAVVPPVCPAGPCLTSEFDPDTGECRTTLLEGPCDDGNACTVDTVCVEGECRGTGLRCERENPCDVRLCDASVGCVSMPDPQACPTDNPCLAPSCDPSSGCSYAVVDDGTICGLVEACAHLPLCLRGVCEVFNVPDDFPCDDGRHCTSGDHCEAGACVGQRSGDSPTIVGNLHTFGYTPSSMDKSQATILPDGRILFADVMVRGHYTQPGTALVTLVGRVGDRLEPLSRLVLSNFVLAYPRAVYALSSSEVLLRGASSSRWISIDGSNGLTSQTVALSGSCSFSDSNGRRLLCATGTQIKVVDFAEGTPTPVHTFVFTVPATVDSVVSSQDGNRLFAGMEDGVWTLDITDPTNPQALGVALPGKKYTSLARYGTFVAALRGNAPYNTEQELVLLSQDALAESDSISLSDLGILAYSMTAAEAFLAVCSSRGVHVFTGGTDGVTPLGILGVLDLSEWTPSCANNMDAKGDLLVMGSMGETLVRRIPSSASQPFEVVTGPYHGELQRLDVAQGMMFANGEGGARILDLTDPAHPALARGGQLDASSGLRALGVGGTPPIVPAATRYDIYSPWLSFSRTSGREYEWTSGSVHGAFIDVSVPDAPLHVGGLKFERDELTMRYVAVGGNRLLSIGCIPSDNGIPGWRFELFDLTAVERSFDTTLVPSSSFVLGTLEGTDDDFGRAGGVAMDETGTLAMIWRYYWGAPYDVPEVLVYDVQAADAPFLVAQTRFDAHGYIDGVLLANGTMAVCAEPSGTPTPTLRVYSVVGNELQMVNELALDAAYSVVSFDEETVVLGKPGSLEWVDVSTQPPVMMGTIALTQNEVPSDLLFVDDKLVAVTSTAIDVVSPPCPPVAP